MSKVVKDWSGDAPDAGNGNVSLISDAGQPEYA
jgi:hypothetical protein